MYLQLFQIKPAWVSVGLQVSFEIAATSKKIFLLFIRHGYERKLQIATVSAQLLQRKFRNRIMTRLVPASNNNHLHPSPQSVLMRVAIPFNHDLQVISNSPAVALYAVRSSLYYFSAHDLCCRLHILAKLRKPTSKYSQKSGKNIFASTFHQGSFQMRQRSTAMCWAPWMPQVLSAYRG